LATFCIEKKLLDEIVRKKKLLDEIDIDAIIANDFASRNVRRNF
jgi:hypothetical protein